MTLRDITPQNGWHFSSLSLALDEDFRLKRVGTPQEGFQFFSSTLVYAGTLAVEDGVRRVAAQIPSDQRAVEVVPFPHEERTGTHREILTHTKRLIGRQIDQAHAQGKGLILGFSAWQAQPVMDLLDLLVYTRQRSRDHALCVVGGPGLHQRAPLLEKALFEAGADILNIHGAEEITHWIGTLPKGKAFFRDEDRKLVTTLPAHLPFFLESQAKERHPRGRNLPAPIQYTAVDNSFEVFLPSQGCSNACDFCAGRSEYPAQLGGKTPQALATFVNGLIEQKIEEHVLRREDKLRLNICNPNPLQGFDGSAEAFIHGLSRRQRYRFSHFGDALSFRDPAIVDQHISYLDRIFKTHRGCRFVLTLSLDAVQAKDDGDFIGRRLHGKPVSEDDYTAMRTNFDRFLDTIAKEPWFDDLGLQLNMIAHPGMTPEVYALKQAARNKVSSLFAPDDRGFAYSRLMPFEGTLIAAKYAGHYAPILEMEKKWVFGNVIPSCKNSLWGNQFAHSDLMDCFAVYRTIQEFDENMYPTVLFDTLLSGWNGDKPRLPDFYANRLEYMFQSEVLTYAQEILSKDQPRVLSMLFHLHDSLLASEAEGTKNFWLPLLSSVYWIREREIYLMEHSPHYKKNEQSALLIDGMQMLIEEMDPRLDEILKNVNPPNRRRRLPRPRARAKTP